MMNIVQMFFSEWKAGFPGKVKILNMCPTLSKRNLIVVLCCWTINKGSSQSVLIGDK